MKNDEIKFTIDQLRKDKIIYATEATATAVACILGLLFTNRYINNSVGFILNVLILIVGVGYTLFMGIGNANRLNKIKQLEKKL